MTEKAHVWLCRGTWVSGTRAKTHANHASVSLRRLSQAVRACRSCREDPPLPLPWKKASTFRSVRRER